MSITIDTMEEKSGFRLEFNQQVFYCQTDLRSNQINGRFVLKELKKDNEKIGLVWEIAEFGEIFQQFFLEEMDQDQSFCSYTLEIISKRDIAALISQSYAFTPEKEPYFMIPGTLYGTNNVKNAKSLQPQFNYRGDICFPKTSVIYTRADRSTHNTVLSITNNTALGIRIDESTSTDDQQFYNGLGINTHNYDNLDRLAVTIGYHHFPVRYIGKIWEKRHTDTPELHYLSFKTGKKYTTKGHICLTKADTIFAYERIVKRFYTAIHQPPGNTVTRKQTINDLTKALINDAYYKKYCYFPTVVLTKDPDKVISGDTGWTGGMQVVYPLVRASKYVKEAQPLVCAYMDNLVSSGVNKESGFFFENKYKDEWSNNGWWVNELHLHNRRLERIEKAQSAYINGQATCYLLKSYQYAKAQKWNTKKLTQWYSVSKQIIDRVIAQQRYDGALGVYYDPSNGEAIYYNSFQGCWFAAGIAELGKITKEQKYLSAFEKANEFYYSFLQRGELWGTPIDTRDAVDEEGNLAYITALKTMHELANKDIYLTQLLHALHYEFSWKFAYNTKFTNEPLKSMKWSSCGGSVTSSHNIHIHQMGNLITEEMYYAYKLTKDEYILNRLKDTLNWGLGTYNIAENHFGFGKKGWATEQFFHTDGIQDDPTRIPDGGVWTDYLSWAAACVLLSCVADIDDELYG